MFHSFVIVCNVSRNSDRS